MGAGFNRSSAAAIALLLLLGTGVAWGPGVASGSQELSLSAARKAAEYLFTRQTPSGSFFADDVNSGSSGGAAEVLASLSAAGVGGRRLASALSYIAQRGPQDASRAAYAGRIVLGLLAAGENPRNFRGFDYVARLDSFYNPTTGSYDQGIYSHALAALAVSATKGDVPEQALQYLIANQCPSGGFSHQEGCLQPRGADVDTTALAVNLFVRHKASVQTSLARARSFLLAARNRSGGFGLYGQDATNANSTGLALSAIAALGEHPTSTEWADGPGQDPLSELLALQEPSGAFQFVAGANDRRRDYATVQAIPGALAYSYPIIPRHSESISPGQAVAIKSPDLSSGSKQSPSHALEPSGTDVSQTNISIGGKAAIVVEDPEKRNSFCITLTEPSISGAEALERLPLPVMTKDFGTGLGLAVCKIGLLGNPSSSCPGSRSHWHFWQFSSGEWVEASTGPSLTNLSPGEAHGWVWTANNATRPPSISRPIENCKESLALSMGKSSAPDQGRTGTSRYFVLMGATIALGAIAGIGMHKGRMREPI